MRGVSLVDDDPSLDALGRLEVASWPRASAPASSPSNAGSLSLAAATAAAVVEEQEDDEDDLVVFERLGLKGGIC